MLYNYLEKLRSEIESVKQTILDVKVIRSMDNYHARTGYLQGLQKALQLFSDSDNRVDIKSDNRIAIE